MNPTDQARKEARKKELKKNKKQRQMVRAAVLKGKDPNQLIAEMEKIDRMEFDVTQPPILNEKVLKDKRKKLRETFERVLRLYEKEDPPQWLELKRLEVEYEKRRNVLIQYFESVKHAQQVQVDDIPLPSVQMPSLEFSHIPLPSDIPLPGSASHPQSILKKGAIPFGLKINLSKYKTPPGVPPGPPPVLSEDEDEDNDSDDEDDANGNMDVDQDGTPMDKDTDASKAQKLRKIRFADDGGIRGDDSDEEKDTRLSVKTGRAPTALQAKMLAMAGQDINDFLKEMEMVQRVTKDGEEMTDVSGKPDKTTEDSAKDVPPIMNQPLLPPMTGLPPGPPPTLPPGPPPGVPNMMFRQPPPLRPGMPLRLPPGPPPGRPGGPPGPPPGLPPRMTGPPLRLPPGPPPGIPPPRLLRPPGMPMPGMPPLPSMVQNMSQQPPPTAANPNVLSAPPSLISRPKAQDEEKKSAATIEAKPQIRNLSVDVIRFMPTSLRVKREDKGRKRDHLKSTPGSKPDEHILPLPKVAPILPTKDDAYDQFMKEMEGLL